MRIIVLFQFNHEQGPVAITGVEGEVADILLPTVGDVVRHKDTTGEAFEGKVTERLFNYDINQGVGIDGAVSVTLCLDRTVVH